MRKYMNLAKQLLRVGAVLALAGCGGGNGGSESGGAAPPTSVTTPPAAAVCSDWSVTASYDAGDVVAYSGKNYTAQLQHTLTTGAAQWTPDATPELWTVGGTCTGPVSTKTAKFPAPAATWQEHWSAHVELLRLVAYNDSVALYLDDFVSRTNTRNLLPFLTKTWKYSQSVYGNPRNKQLDTDRLFFVAHQQTAPQYAGAQMATLYDANHDYRNVIDYNRSDWSKAAEVYEDVLMQTARILEVTASGRHGSPAYPLWHVSKWAELFTYDTYKALGMDAEALAYYNKVNTRSESFPLANSYWFREFFFPTWRDHGKAQVMAKFFALLGDNFPAKAAPSQDFARDMNMGEFIHFMSAAAGTDLRPQAKAAFGLWLRSWEASFQQARTDFPNLTYTLGSTPEMPPAPPATFGTCGTANGATYVLAYSSPTTRWCVSAEVWDTHAADLTSTNLKYFDYGEQILTTLGTLFASPQPAGKQFTYQVDAPNGIAHTGTNFGDGVSVTGDAFWNVVDTKLSNGQSVSITGFWGYLLTLHEAINVWTGRVSGGWPMDWWADHLSPFPNSMDYHVMLSIGQSQGNTTLTNAALFQHERFGVAGLRDYEPEVAMFDNFYDRFGGYAAFVRTFSLLQGDGLKFDGVDKSNPGATRTEYTMAYLHLGFRTTADLTSEFIAAGVGTKDKMISPYVPDKTHVKAIADAHCSIAGARGDPAVSATTLNTALANLRSGAYATAKIAAQQSCALTATDKKPAECTCAANGQWVAPWSAAQ
jgi:hypothetical protein